MQQQDERTAGPDPAGAAASTRDERREALKDSIRTAARELFVAGGFEATGVRDIAAAAGVNPAIVIRHFGSKEALFLETMAMGMSLTAVLDCPIEETGRAVVAAMIDADEAPWRTFAALVRASDREEVRTQLRATFERGIAPRLVPRITGPDAELRVHLFIAQLSGLLTAFAVYEDNTLSGASRDDIVRIYGASMQSLLTVERGHGAEAG